MRTDFLKFAHAAGKLDLASDVPGFLADMIVVIAGNQGAYAQIIRSLADAVLDNPVSGPSGSSPAFKPGSPDGGELLIAADKILEDIGPMGAGSNDVLLSRWAFSGALDPLAELIRRFLNRDGSSESLGIGMDAVGLVMEAQSADAEFAAALERANFRPLSHKFGVYPPGSFSLPLVEKAHIPRDSRRPTAGQIAAGGAVARSRTAAAPGATPVAEVIPAPAAHVARRHPSLVGGSAGPNTAVADMDAGTVRIGGASLSITAAIKAGESITRAVVELLRPAEGFAWLDDNHDPQSRSILVDLDGERAKGLEQVGGGFLQGEVLQIPSRGPDPEAGKYLGRLYTHGGGFAEFALGVDDVNAAKFKVAERVRQELKTPA